jgi:hypothetical protein
VILTVSAIVLMSAVNSSAQAVNTKAIDQVRNKGVLESSDFQIIDDFVAEAIAELVNTKDFTSIAKVRAIIVSRNSSKVFENSDQNQYSVQFSESAYKYISAALKEVYESMPQDNHGFEKSLNLLILIDELENLRLAELALERLTDESRAIRYWAVHAVTSAAIVRQLNSGKEANIKLAMKITEQLKGLVEQSCPEIIAMSAEFAAKLDIPEGEDLLLQIADMRIKKYADWTVQNELVDIDILKALYSKMTSTGANTPAVARRFGQLYSYIIQRYVKGRDILSDTQKQQLASVLVETENYCIWKLMGTPQATIKRAVEQNDYTGLLAEHNSLLGDQSQPGQLVLRLNFDYGRDADGTARTAPLDLPAPPK